MLLTSYNIHIFVLTDVGIKPNHHFRSDIHLPGFKIYINTTIHRAGGVMIGIKEDINLRLITSPSVEDGTYILDIVLQNTRKIYITAIY